MTKIMKIKHNTKRKKYIKKKKNNKTIKRRKHYSKKTYGGGPMSVNQRQNLITKYKLDLDKLLNKFKNNINSVSTDQDFYNAIESIKVEINEIIDKYICILLVNDIATDAPNDKVVQEINKYVKETVVDLSKARSKIPNLPPSYPLIQSKDIIPLFINKYLSRMDIIFKYIKGHILSIDNELDALLFIFRTIYSSKVTDETKSKIYHIIFKIYEDKIKNYTDEVYTTTEKGKQRHHKMVTLMMILAPIESNFDLIKFIVFNNVDIQDYLINKHKSVKDFILSYGDIRFIKLTRTIPIYNYWNSIVERLNGINIFGLKNKLLEYVKTNDICKSIRAQLPGFTIVDNSIILDEFPYCYGLLLVSVASYLLQDKCSLLLMGGKSNQLALYDKFINIDRNTIPQYFYDVYVDMYKQNSKIGSDFYMNLRPTLVTSNPEDLKNKKIILSTIKMNIEDDKFYEEFQDSMKSVISQYKSYDIDIKVLLNDIGSEVTQEEVVRKTQKVARNISLLIEWLSEENGYLKFKYHRSSFSSTYKIGYLSDNKIRERMPSEESRSEESLYLYYNNEVEYLTQDLINEMSEDSKQTYENNLNAKGEKLFVPKYYTEIIDIGYDTSKMNTSSFEKADLHFGDLNGIIKYRKLDDIIDTIRATVSEIESNPKSKPNDLYYKGKAIKQLNIFNKTREIYVLQMMRLVNKYNSEFISNYKK